MGLVGAASANVTAGSPALRHAAGERYRHPARFDRHPFRKIRMRIRHHALLKVVSLVTLAVGAVGAQSHATVADLFQRLGQGNTDWAWQAAYQLIDLGKSDPQIRSYLVMRIPGLIAKNPHENPDQWDNATAIAGELKITQACPELERWVGEPNVGPNETTLSEVARLMSDPAARALSQIGEPAIPTLKEILNTGSVPARTDAVRALQIIGSPAAMTVLQQREPHETNRDIKGFIDYVLAAKDRGGGR